MDTVKAWSQTVVIPTYAEGEADKNPMFLEKRVYQGSSGKVYPHPMTESISDVKTDKEYTAVFLENEYLKVMVLPELGGRIQRATDKTNGYDFVYYNHVIKPALVGLAGPWISGGIEFNWPQHHRPSTYDPVEWKITENADGSKTVWVSEIEKMYHTKGMAGFTLYPGKSYIEISGQLYNPTERPQTFLWWANPAVPVNDYTKSIFPPDVHAVMDHGKRDVSKFPIATGTYYKYDYSEGVDISMYKNIPVPTSYMAYKSDFDFIGNYDFSVDAGLLHVADHHVNPGKKQWTWGSGDFGKAWDRNLTDEDGPYIELMTGLFTDNQPDFSYIAPYEERRFTQYFMPYKAVGEVKNATADAMINLTVADGIASVKAYATSVRENARITLKANGKSYISDTVLLSPVQPYSREVPVDVCETELTLSVYDSGGALLVEYTPLEKKIEEIPSPAQAAKLPEDCASCEELYLTAVHLEQYRHATYSPKPYYIEGLKRDPSDIRLNNGYGKLLYKNGEFEKSIKYFNAAIKKATWKNPNPYDGEPFYNLGLALEMTGDKKTAFDKFYKATWNGAMQDAAFYKLAAISCSEGRYKEALEYIDKSIWRNYHNTKARCLKSSLLRLTGGFDEAAALDKETLSVDPLDFGALYELYVMGDNNALSELTKILRGDPHNYTELSLSYAESGQWREALSVLSLIKDASDPMVWYYRAYYKKQLGGDASAELSAAENAPSLYCFPNRLYDILVLESAVAENNGAMAHYYLGCLLYDKEQYSSAVAHWEAARSLKPDFPTVHRNLSLAYYNKQGNISAARESMELAFSLDTSDARVFMELDTLYKALNIPVAERLDNYRRNMPLITLRDDLYAEYVTLLNLNGLFAEALEAAMSHKFHPWEGGEGKITAQYRISHTELAKELMAKGDNAGAAAHLEAALAYPENLGEGKLIGEKDNDIYYLLAAAYESIDKEKSEAFCRLAATGDDNLGSAAYYNDQPPEMFFYQALASRRLGDEHTALSKFNKLVDYGEAHIFDNVRIDYFAVSLPDLLIYESDLNKKNYVHCCHLIALGKFGLGLGAECEEYMAKASAGNVSDSSIAVNKRFIEKYGAFIK